MPLTKAQLEDCMVQIKILSKRIRIYVTDILSLKEIVLEAQDDPSSCPLFFAKLEAAKETLGQFNQTWEKLEVLHVKVGDDDFPKPSDLTYRSQVLETIQLAQALRIKLEQSKPIDEVKSLASDSKHGKTTLPSLSLPQFSGDISLWVQFRDTFTSLVHNDSSLTPVEKYHYLISSLSGEALQLVTQYQISDANYQLAWKSLLDTYNNNRVLANIYLEKILNYRSISSNSLDNLKGFLTHVADNISAFRALKLAKPDDVILSFLALRTLDSATRHQYELSQLGTEFPTIDNLMQFVRNGCQALKLSSSGVMEVKSDYPSKGSFSSAIQRPKFPLRSSRKYNATLMSHTRPAQISDCLHRSKSSRQEPAVVAVNQPRKEMSQVDCCPFCRQQHSLFRCFDFALLSPSERKDFTLKWKGCVNCLRSTHSAKECTSKLNCRYCKQRHHSLLHQPAGDTNTSHSSSSLTAVSNQQTLHAHTRSGDDTSQSKGKAPQQAFCASFSSQGEAVLLGTAQTLILDNSGRFNTVRVLFDSGSTRTLITQRCANRLNLPITPTNSGVSGLGGGSNIPVYGKVSCQIHSRHDISKFIQVDALVIPSITNYLPLRPLPPEIVSYFQSFVLADPDFGIPQGIEVLLGSDILNHIICGPPQFVGRHLPFVTSTLFGDMVSGSFDSTADENLALFTLSIENINRQLAKFWELEEVLPVSHASPDDLFCEQHFRETHTRSTTGRYIVKLPCALDKPLGDNRSIALRRFHRLELKFSRESLLKKGYKLFMKEYKDLGHMSSARAHSSYIIPHHAIQKGKLRVVFDGSCPSTTHSLNEILLPGPKLQADVGDILLRFRFHRFAVVADLVKMYRQILVHEDDRKYQHILWREDPCEEIEEYELNTVTYGLTPSAFLAMRTVKQLVADEGAEFPLASRSILEDMYVDDVVTGADTAEEAQLLCQQMIECFSRGGFSLGKWASNNTEILPPDAEADKNQISIEPKDSSSVKILGLIWNPKTDIFAYSLTTPPAIATKRIVLSTIARIFDPLGFLSPVVLTAKLLLQQLWKLNAKWDDQLPSELLMDWERMVQQWPLLQKVEIPRFICKISAPKNYLDYDLFGFCDASAKGYAAVIYLKVENTCGGADIRLLKSKTKVAPLKYNSIARLELCAAVLLAKLYSSVIFPKTVKIRNTYFFSDSAVVLAWLHTAIHKLKTFEAHRISVILEYTRLCDWFHVKSDQNPADHASRGLMPSDIIHNSSWWYGPTWIKESISSWPATSLVCKGQSSAPSQQTTDSKLPSLLSRLPPGSTRREPYWLLRFRSARILYKTVARLFRFFSLMPLQDLRPTNSATCLSEVITASELKNAQNACVRMVQRIAFPKGILTSSLLDLCPFLDSAGLLRMGGRLRNAPISEDSKFPIILPPHSHLTELIVMDIHTRHYHAGPNLTLSLLRTQFWIPSACRTIKSLTRRCLECRRRYPKSSQPLMAPLPASRFAQGRPFIQVGVDFAGPFLLRDSLRRKSQVSKVYLCLFICFATKAVHLEAVTSLSTEAFLATLDRFISRRGLPSVIHSDNGTNFVGASRYLKDIYKSLLQFHSTLSQTLAYQGIVWNFSPPRAPHFGGLWEAGIKSVKRLLPTAVGSFPLTYEELSTIFARVEALLNSRPLCPLNENPDNLEVLTPGHFLIGTSLKEIPPEDLTSLPTNRLSRWQLVQQRIQHVWSRWSKEYLHTLQQRSKWTKTTQAPSPGEVVILMEKRTTPGHWPLARILKTHPGADGIVRVVTVTLPSGSELRRAVSSIAFLPKEES